MPGGGHQRAGLWVRKESIYGLDRIASGIAIQQKTLRLKRILRIKTAQAVGHVCMLWLWALDNAQDGDLTRFSAGEIAEVSGWCGKRAEDFVAALQGGGLP